MRRSRMSQGAEGIGLFRSELLLAGRPADELTEDMQYEVYRQLLEDVRPAPVTVRTFDIDEDQLASGEQRRDTLWASGYEVPRSRLGLRSIRLTLKRRELLRTQLRALVRAAAHGDLRVMFPFVSGIEELREARSVLAEARQEIEARRMPSGTLQVGVMIEVPSAAFTADLLAAESRFSDHRHQRPDSVLSGGRSHRRARVASVRAAAPGDSSADPSYPPRGSETEGAAVGVRRDGVGSRRAGAAHRDGARAVQHDARRRFPWRSR